LKDKCKKSGFYWMRNDCADKTIRVYCDFKTGDGSYYAYYGRVKDENPDITGANTYEGIHRQCSKLGLYPVEINTEDQLVTVLQYLKDLNIDT
jgi:hypothetical protein